MALDWIDSKGEMKYVAIVVDRKNQTVDGATKPTDILSKDIRDYIRSELMNYAEFKEAEQDALDQG